jgi:N-methylhydantoinase B/oxoprolinase/acetone carboxylase alpha subunit
MVKIFRDLRRNIKKVFREFLVYHNSSLEYRAKVITLVLAINNEISDCEEELLKKMALEIYDNDEERSDILIETVKEYFVKIETNNGLDFEHLVYKVEKETKAVKRFAEKIDIEKLMKFQACVEDEEDKIYQLRVIEFLKDLKERYE